MSFSPILPMGGYAGWQFLSRTMERQQEAFANTAEMKRTVAYFRENVGTARSAEDVVQDRRLLQVALGAFGLDEDINARAFIGKVLEEGTIRSDALSSKLADKRYAALSRAFGFGDLGGRTILPSFPDEILSRFVARQFERAVGEQDGALRQALNFRDGLADVLEQNGTARGRWFAIMGNPPLRGVFEAAFGLPSSFGRLDVDQQLATFMDRAERSFGTSDPAGFAEPERQEDLIRLFLIRNEAANGRAGSSAGQVALSLLQSMPRLQPPGPGR